MKDKISKLKIIVESRLKCPVHSIDHILRVYNLCLHLAKKIKVDREVLLGAALLHDIGQEKESKDKSGETDHAIESSKMAVPILKKLEFPKEKIVHIRECIETHRYRTKRKPKTIEAKILFDADKIDSLGAIGIARSYTWIGKNNGYIYKKVNLKRYAKENLTSSKGGRIKDKSKHSPQIEYELKTKNIASELYTSEAKKVARERTRYYKSFLDRLEKEVKGLT